MGLAILYAAVPAIGAERIVSTAPNFTEILFALGAGSSVVAVSDYCEYPEEATAKPRIGGPFNLDYERILALRSDRVIVPASLGEVAEKLRALDVPVLRLGNESVGEVLESITRLGELTGRNDSARELRRSLRRRLDAVERLTEPLPRVRALVVVFRAAGSLQDLTVASPGSFLDELLRRAGGENVMGETLALYPRLSKEELVGLDPEVILDLTFTAGGEDVMAVWSRLPTLKAVRERRVVALPDPAITIPGPRMVETLERFVDALHPRARANDDRSFVEPPRLVPQEESAP